MTNLTMRGRCAFPAHPGRAVRALSAGYAATRRSHLRRCCTMLLWLMAWLFSPVALAQSPTAAPQASTQPAAEVDRGVRTGTTELSAPAAEAKPGGAASGSRGLEAPADAPRLVGKKLKLPATPASFNVHDGGWIQFAYPPSERQRVQPLIADADAIRAELSARLGEPVLSAVTVHVARTPGEMADLAPDGAPFPRYAAGVAYSQVGLILLTIAPLYPNSVHDLGEIFRHELAHVALYDALGGRAIPRWFNEGFAVFASGEGSMVRLRTLWTATVADSLLPLAQLERTFPSEALTASVAYAQAADVVRFLVRRQDSRRFAALVRRMRRGQSFDRALEDAYGTDLSTLEHEWREDLKKRYTFWPVVFSGGVVWVGIIGLIVWTWRRKRKRNRLTLDRWAKEEAAADALQRQVQLTDQNRRLHVVLTRAAQPAPPELPGGFPEPEVPKVEHKGEWHTLH